MLRMALHQLGYITRYYYLKTKKAPVVTQKKLAQAFLPGILHIPSTSYFEEDFNCIPAAEEIVAGFFHPFCGESEPLTFTAPYAEQHWTEIRDSDPENDLKLFWEPARFTWIHSLIRAYSLTHDTRYAEAFWKHWHSFQSVNSPYQGVNWVSAQEVAIRIICWIAALQVFENDPATTQANKTAILQSIYEHAFRIPCTIGYAKAQKNNHLLTEAAGLYTAGCLFKHLPIGKRWMRMGWHSFTRGIPKQIDSLGNYTQQSTNYHRLMMQTSIWMSSLARTQNKTLPLAVLQTLQNATLWLTRQMDAISGQVSNLGHNDGTYLFPFSSLAYEDYRPVVQTASCLFLRKAVFPSGPWDEMVKWFIPPEIEWEPVKDVQIERTFCRGNTLLLAGLRMTRFINRPAHADQLHTELWWEGKNIVLDPGTYRYTAPEPWDNRLARATYHNTMTVDNQEPMLWAGRFLWLDWYKVFIVEGDDTKLTARHTGYQRMGVDIFRTIQYNLSNCIEIKDFAISNRKNATPHLLRIHWMLPDWKWEIKKHSFTIFQPDTTQAVEIQMSTDPEYLQNILELQLIRAGQVLHGVKEANAATFGWYSPTYNLRVPALSLRASITTQLPLSIFTRFNFPQF